MENAFVFLIDFLARELVEVVLTNHEESLDVDDSEKIAKLACDLLDNHEVVNMLKERVKASLAV